jgi:hypothetical protein
LLYPDKVEDIEAALEALGVDLSEPCPDHPLVGSPLPLRIQVQVDAKGRPSLLKWGGWTRFVRGVLDHWRTSSRWWQQPVEREHYLVQTQNGSTYSVYAQDQRWYIDRKYPR